MTKWIDDLVASLPPQQQALNKARGMLSAEERILFDLAMDDIREGRVRSLEEIDSELKRAKASFGS
jgi:hypothetical protein